MPFNTLPSIFLHSFSIIDVGGQMIIPIDVGGQMITLARRC